MQLCRCTHNFANWPINGPLTVVQLVHIQHAVNTHYHSCMSCVVCSTHKSPSCIFQPRGINETWHHVKLSLLKQIINTEVFLSQEFIYLWLCAWMWHNKDCVTVYRKSRCFEYLWLKCHFPRRQPLRMQVFNCGWMLLFYSNVKSWQKDWR